MPSAEQDQERGKKLLSLRLPLDLYNRVVARAEKERRSIHNQLLVLIEEALSKPEKEAHDGP